MSGSVQQFLLDTLLVSGGLIVAVLALRGVVSRYFGPQVAYALWALPLLRLFMPPLVLPAGMAPAVAPSGEGSTMVIGEANFASVNAAHSGVMAEVLMAVWLAGALLFIGWRIRQYRSMRCTILNGSRPVGETGQVRLVETPATALPLALGIVDKVVALPPGFMALHDRAARDLAIAHELEHHRGHDLLANLAAQLLLALHWFNPVAWIGWRAMRKDQEAACDARVVAGRQREDRATYAEVIAGFATGKRLELTAPLACSIVGEKSIIHRLRSLTLAETSLTRRRIGIGVVAAIGLALPLTATISYAQPEEAPPAPRIDRRMVIVDVPKGAAPNDPGLHTTEMRRADGTVVTLRTANPVSITEAEARVDAAIASMPALPDAPEAPATPQPPQPPQRVERRIMTLDNSGDAQTVEVSTRCANTGEGRVDACSVSVIANTLEGLVRAREVISEASMTAEQKQQALREIDQAIAVLREGSESSANTWEYGLDQPVVRVSWRIVTGKPTAAGAPQRVIIKPVPTPDSVAVQAPAVVEQPTG